MAQKIWNDSDTIHVGLWKQLLYWQCDGAAVGLLDDVFAWLIVMDESPPKVDEEDPRATIREDAMMMLGDSDGGKLRDWVNLYRTDKGTWKLRAQDWVTHCREADPFGLFTDDRR